jgi:PKD repeat protein
MNLTLLSQIHEKTSVFIDALITKNLGFDGNNDFMNCDFGTSIPQPATIFVIWKHNLMKNQNIFGSFATPGFAMYFPYSVTNAFIATASTIGGMQYDKPLTKNNTLSTIIFNSNSYFYDNGILKANTTSAGTNSMDGFTLGSTFATDQRFLNGNIAEIIFYDTVLSDTDRQMVERYLHDKYFPPVNLGYDIRVPYGFCDTAITTAYKPWFTSYFWSTGETDSIIHVNRPGVYSVTVTDIFGFESSDDIRVFYPEVNDFADTIVCFGGAVVWDLELAGAYTYEWYGSSETSRSINITTEGLYAAIITDTIGTGCKYFTDTISFSFDNYEFTASVGPADTALCAGNRLMLVANAGETVSYVWNTGSTSPEIVLNTSGTYSVSVTNWRGCEATDAIDVTINGTVPVPLFSSDGHCAQNPVYFTDLSTSTDGTINSWTWSINGNIFSTSKTPYSLLATYRPARLCRPNFPQEEINPNLLRQQNATARLYRVVPTENGRETESSGNIPSPHQHSETESSGNIPSPHQHNVTALFPAGEINPNLLRQQNATARFPEGEINLNLLRKHNDTARLYRVVPPENSRETESSGNIPYPHQHNETESSGISRAANYEVKLVISTSAGCSDFIINPLPIYPLPTISFTPDYFCQYAPVEFTSTSQVAGGTISENIWDFNGTQQSGTNANHTFTQSGNNPITLTSTSDVGCLDSLVTEVYVKNASLPVFSTENACEGSEIYFVNNTEVLVHNLPLEWNWDFGDGSTGSGSDPAHIYENAGIYDVAVSVVWQNRCVVPATAQVEVYHNPSLSLQAEDECINVPFSIEKTVASLSGNVVNYDWTFGSENPQISANENPQFSSSVPGEYPLNLNIETEYGCVASAVDTVVVHENPHALFTASRIWGAVPMEVEFTNNSEGASTYLWSFGDTGTATDEDPVYIFTGEGEFDVVLQSYSQFGCVDDTLIRIKTVIPF